MEIKVLLDRLHTRGYIYTSVVKGLTTININRGYFMEKTKFERFISKYNLGGSCESVLYDVQDETLMTRAISDDKNVLCEINAPCMGLVDGSYAVYETAKLRSLLGVLGEQLTVTPKKSSHKTVGLQFSDKNTEVTFVLADASVIPTVPELKKLPPFDLTIVMDEQFITTFVKAKGALSDVETFTVISTGEDKTASVILGHSSLNTNRVKIGVNTKEEAAVSAISFSAKYLREILVANKEAKVGELQISSKGLAKTTFVSDGITSTYYLVQIDTKE